MTLHKRIIARLDVKPPNLVKGVQLEGFRVIGDPAAAAMAAYDAGIDEVIYIDVVASLYQRNGILDLVRRTAERVFVPLAAGGGLRSVEDARALLLAGADKVTLNTAAVQRPALIGELARAFGSQAVTIVVEYVGSEPLTNCARERTGLVLDDWCRRVVDLGAGEILLTCVQRDGTRTGMDLRTIERIATLVGVPIVAHGGARTPSDIRAAFDSGADGVAVASMLHYHLASVAEIKLACPNTRTR